MSLRKGGYQLKHRIVLTPEQTLEFFKLDEKERIGLFIETKSILSNNDERLFRGKVESYSMGYGVVTLLCEGEEVFKTKEVK